MRNAVEHPNSAELVIKNFTREGDALNEPTWAVKKAEKTEYGPVTIVDDMACAIRNLLVLAEDMRVMWSQANLVAPGLVAVAAIPEAQRKAECPVKYRIRPTAAALQEIAIMEAGRRGT